MPVSLDYRGLQIEVGFRADLLLRTRLVLELMAIEAVTPLHRTHVITYLQLLKLLLVLLINVNSLLLRDGLERILDVPRHHP